MTDILYDTSPTAVVAALEANWRDYRRSWGRHPTVTIRDDERFFWFMTGMPHGWVNAILRANVAAVTVDAAIDEAIGAFAQRGIPWYWIVGPASTPSDLPARLQAHGFHHVGQCPAMSLELPTTELAITLPPDLVIQPVTAGATLELWLQTPKIEDEVPPAIITQAQAIQRASVGHPGKYEFVGLLDGVPVATATLLLAGGVAGIYGIDTVAAARRRGIGAAMTLTALRAAQRQGYRIATLQASPLGFPVYQRLGFALCHQFDIYAPAGVA